MTVEGILNRFQKELEDDAMAFLDQASRVCTFDAVVRDSQRALSQLATVTQRLLLEQQQVESMLIGIDSFQAQLEQTLDHVEAQVDQLFVGQSHLSPLDADVQREKAYQMALTVDSQLETLESTLASTLQELNTVTTSSTTATTHNNNNNHDASLVVVVLNQHQDSLLAVEAATRQLELDVKQVGKMLQQQQQQYQQPPQLSYQYQQ
jgi:nuclear pore complex protein Nup62